MNYKLFWANLYSAGLLVLYAIAGTAVALWSITPTGSIIFVCLIVIGVLAILANKR
ncbi:MAG: hypothetical protein F6K47_04430 [Symploca sp. SIO2E6]|nr:hypothetical protein [Symploca sp. SIO2E6]